MKNENRITFAKNGMVFEVSTVGGNCFGQYGDTYIFKEWDELQSFLQSKLVQEVIEEVQAA